MRIAIKLINKTERYDDKYNNDEIGFELYGIEKEVVDIIIEGREYSVNKNELFKIIETLR